ncbi:hypothetical protein BB560_000556 [Smittium megazygosporum]|uniref:Rho-GAP domain-containing protein n=1 Tax=Smittium megazygosporum TaxID=133381 RepID=A0A2T9ZK06_9FUNG|nr:hypothetical protein BB560_000556 [Smittium megazygosporum]
MSIENSQPEKDLSSISLNEADLAFLTSLKSLLRKTLDIHFPVSTSEFLKVVAETNLFDSPGSFNHANTSHSAFLSNFFLRSESLFPQKRFNSLRKPSPAISTNSRSKSLELTSDYDTFSFLALGILKELGFFSVQDKEQRTQILFQEYDQIVLRVVKVIPPQSSSPKANPPQFVLSLNKLPRRRSTNQSLSNIDHSEDVLWTFVKSYSELALCYDNLLLKNKSLKKSKKIQDFPPLKYFTSSSPIKQLQNKILVEKLFYSLFSLNLVNNLTLSTFLLSETITVDHTLLSIHVDCLLGSKSGYLYRRDVLSGKFKRLFHSCDLDSLSLNSYLHEDSPLLNLLTLANCEIKASKFPLDLNSSSLDPQTKNRLFAHSFQLIYTTQNLFSAASKNNSNHLLSCTEKNIIFLAESESERDEWVFCLNLIISLIDAKKGINSSELLKSNLEPSSNLAQNSKHESPSFPRNSPSERQLSLSDFLSASQSPKSISTTNTENPKPEPNLLDPNSSQLSNNVDIPDSDIFVHDRRSYSYTVDQIPSYLLAVPLQSDSLPISDVPDPANNPKKDSIISDPVYLQDLLDSRRRLNTLPVESLGLTPSKSSGINSQKVFNNMVDFSSANLDDTKQAFLSSPTKALGKGFYKDSFGRIMREQELEPELTDFTPLVTNDILGNGKSFCDSPAQEPALIVNTPAQKSILSWDRVMRLKALKFSLNKKKVADTKESDTPSSKRKESIAKPSASEPNTNPEDSPSSKSTSSQASVEKGLVSPLLSQPVFGKPLELSAELTCVRPNYPLPAIVYRCIEYLDAENAADEEGIYRLSGSSKTLDILKLKFDTLRDFNLLNIKKNNYIDNSSGSNVSLFFDVHTIASLLKLYLRTLPVNILTPKLHSFFTGLSGIYKRESQIKLAGHLSVLLPIANFALLRALFAHLIRIVRNSHINRMTLRNIGIVFSPTLGIPVPIINLFLREFEYIFNVNETTGSPEPLYPSVNSKKVPVTLDSDFEKTGLHRLFIDDQKLSLSKTLQESSSEFSESPKPNVKYIQLKKS